MKIQQIDVFRVDYELIADEYNWSRGQTVTSMNSTVCKVATDDGLVGWGEVCPLGPFYLPAYAAGARAGIAELSQMSAAPEPKVEALQAAKELPHRRPGDGSGCWG